MDEEYDVIILGTGLTECMLSGILAVEGKRVLHMDRNDFYGGECASVNLKQLYEQFRDGAEPPKELGRERDYLIDLIPKFLMTGEGLIKVLVYTDVVRYLEFRAIATSMVYNGGKIYKVPSTPGEATLSSLVGVMQKLKARSFFEFLQKWQEAECPAEFQGVNVDEMSMSRLYDHYSLNEDTQEFIGHAMALYLDEHYKAQPARATCDRVIMYANSAARALADSRNSPYIYPQYGLGDLPQAFARLSAVYAGTFMLATPVDEIVREDGKFVGVRSGDKVAKAKQVIGDPSYFRDSVRKADRVIRAICILKEPIPKTNADSAQIILPQRQTGRKHDIYVTCLSSDQKICPKGFYVASISTIAETSGDPKEEIALGLKMLGPIEQIFVSVSDVFEPTADGTKDSVFISRSYDATSHFETVYDDVKDMYRRITGKDLVLQKRPKMDEVAGGDAA
ncbi:Rab GDP dissociation inhibitor alpha [Coemansia sp. RSA 552]|nr:Rab GDP dissociation inhibitor alpha [Coemansia sp. RSA 552]